MQDVNNDMDDLFRKAAEQYPLKTKDTDWDKVLAGLTDSDAPMPAAINEQKRSKRVLWLLCLLPLCFLYVPLRNHLSTGKQSESATSLSKQSSITSQQNNTTASNDQAVQTVKQQTDHSLNNDSDNNISDNNNYQEQSFDANGNKLLGRTGAAQIRIIKSNGLNATTDWLSAGKDKNKKIIADEVRNDNEANSKDELTLNKNNGGYKQPDGTSTRIQTITTGTENTNTEQKKESAVTDTTNSRKIDRTVAKENKERDKKERETKKQMQWQQGFYGGLMGSFDMSTIKLQRINKTGYGLQVLAGYRFSKHLSVETGLGWSLKNYYSEGKYFDKKKTGIPDAINIYYTNGNCKMFEVPLNVKYDFAVHKKNSLFATAGFSSYFMKKENYSYRGDYMGWVYDTTRHYSNSGTNWFSLANFSVGYQLQLNKHSSLRIEPYIKVPLHGVGIANLPITSTGISVGFTRRF